MNPQIDSQNKINPTITEEINKNVNDQKVLNFEENTLQKNKNGEKMLFNKDFDTILNENITKKTFQPEQNINYMHNEVKTIIENENNQIPIPDNFTVPRSVLFPQSIQTTNLNNPEITTSPNKIKELFSQPILKENNNSNQEIKIIQEIKNITPITFPLFSTLPPIPLNAQQQFMSQINLKAAENDLIKNEIKSTNNLQSIPLNLRKKIR
ncbi:hypothetical protein Mgra_00007421 [Meloidogyne graminicola]|uniref:Uncharacterized protein n=1 Tax=Meloidogyne graminicola TaxID=189291 RepID=A0A8S9ZID4_9BILA|nr:hypothetical protein Mgra_00007421 [Meloidogyne graminicola]